MVMAEMSRSVPMIVRIHKQGCPACENSEDAWKEFCDKSKGIRIVQVEEQAVPHLGHFHLHQLIDEY
jgi:hypothetical protein